MHASSDGKVLLAFGAAELPPGALPALTTHTVTRRGALERQLEEIRVCGWATAVGDFEEGLNGVAAPIFGRGGDCVGALSVSGPEYRVPASRLAKLGPLTAAAARTIGTRLDARAAA